MYFPLCLNKIIQDFAYSNVFNNENLNDNEVPKMFKNLTKNEVKRSLKILMKKFLITFNLKLEEFESCFRMVLRGYVGD